MKQIALVLLLFISVCSSIQAKQKRFTVVSPDKKTEVRIELGDRIAYSLRHNDLELLSSSPLSMELYDGSVLGANPRLIRQSRRSVDCQIEPLYGQSSLLRDHFNELDLRFSGNFGLIFRVYNEGVAFRFVTTRKDALKIKNEKTSFVLPESCNAYYRKGHIEEYMYEPVYEYSPVSQIDSNEKQTAALPVLVQVPDGPKLGFIESDIYDYPGMYVTAKGDTLTSCFRGYPLETDMESGNNWQIRVTKFADYIAETSGTRTFPWRIITIADTDTDLLYNDMVYLLAPERAKKIDFSWVKPGLIANDWWNLWWDRSPGMPGVQEVILTGVDFRSGTNFETYKYFIDYAKTQGIPYVNMDYGWCNVQDFSQIHPHLDLQRVLEYSRQQGVPLFMWCIVKTLIRDLDKNMKMFADWGVAGLKVDFFERDDQLGINVCHQIAEAAARHGLMVEFHGAMNPAGLSRKWPNVLTYESVFGSEQNFGTDKVTPKHNVTIPFIRSVAGPYDYAPGAMNNVTKDRFHPFVGFPLTQGTRAHQIAMFVIYYSPLQFTCDVPSNYLRYPDCIQYISQIPVVWDATLPLSGKIGEYVAMARKKGKTWYLAAMAGDEAKQLCIRCDFLDAGEYNVEIFRDGVNADLNGNDYKIEQRSIRSGEEINIEMAPGGGFTARFIPFIK